MTSLAEWAGIPTRRTRRECPRSFLTYCTRLGVDLAPGQRALASVAYDGIQPRDLTGDARDLARRIFGEVEEVPAAARGVLVAICGARAGKTYVLGALRALHLALTVDLSTMAPGEQAIGLIVAPTEELAKQAINYVAGAAETMPADFGRCVKSLADVVVVERPDGQQVEIVIAAASGKGTNLRGRSLVAALLDESAFFRDKSYKVNDEELFKAANPRVLPGGQTILITTPWTDSGLAYDLFVANHPSPACSGIHATGGKPVTALAAHAPTLLLRDSALTQEIVAREEARDPENARREFGAQFVTAGADKFFDSAAIQAAIDQALVIPRAPRPGEQVKFGADFGFVSDSSALAAIHVADGIAITGDLLELRPEPGAPLRPSETVAAFATRMRAQGGYALMADGHYREAIDEYLAKERLGFVDAPTMPADAFVTARTLLHGGRVRIPEHERFIRQLKDVIGRRLSGGRVQIIQPRWRTGGHGDLVSAWVLALHQASGSIVQAPAPEPGNHEAMRQQAEAIRERRRSDLKKNEQAGAWRRRA